MAQATRDENNVPTLLAVLDTNGTTITQVAANPSNHGLKADDAVSGSDNGPTGRALRDQNFVTTLLCVSEDDGVTPVAIYADVDGKLLIDST